MTRGALAAVFLAMGFPLASAAAAQLTSVAPVFAQPTPPPAAGSAAEKRWVVGEAILEIGRDVPRLVGDFAVVVDDWREMLSA